MMVLKTKLTAEPSTTVETGKALTLAAALLRDGSVTDNLKWEWTRRRAGTKQDFELDNTGGPQHDVATAKSAKWEYRAEPLDAGGAKLPNVQLKTITVTITGEEVNPDKPPLAFNTSFAWVVAVLLVVAVVLFTMTSGLFDLTVGIGEKAREIDPRAALAAKVMGPILVVGTALLATGVWMVAVEWRGGFAAARKATETQNKGLLESALVVLKDLKGPSLLVVGGIAVIFAVAWMVTSTVAGDIPDPPSSSTAPADPSGTPSDPSEPPTPSPTP
jgi:hypothetical protein